MTDAYEIVCRSEDPQWLAHRQTGIGASEAAALLDASPWLSRLGLYAQKLGAVAAPDLDDVEVVTWGRLLEPVVAAEYRRRSCRYVDRGGVLLRSRAYPWALATLDGWTATEELGPYWPLEVKTAGVGQAEHWVDGPPEHYRAQLAWQMLVTDTTRATIACLVGGQRLVWCDVERDARLERRLIHAGEALWARIEARDPPAPDGSEASRRTLGALYPQDSGDTIALPGDLADELDQLEAAKAELKRAKSRTTAAENAIKAALGKAARGVLPDGRAVSWTTTDRAGYTVAPTTVRTLRLHAAKR